MSSSSSESDEENPQAQTCSLPHCDEAAQAGCDQHHFLCNSCFCAYAATQFEAMGAFECERLNNNNIVSARGELPCFRFLMNECDCGSLEKTTIARVLSTDETALEAYESAKRRIIQEEYDEELAGETTESTAQEEEEMTVERLHDICVTVLSQGGYTKCPHCGQHGQKNDACIHMRCPYCLTDYCYCCGRFRSDRGEQNVNTSICKSDGSGCDTPSAYLERHPGWRNFNRSDETRGMGALHEFHRRRMKYFLRQVKQHYGNDLWRELKRQYPHLLENVPTNGRCIKWNEIDNAQPPLFGQTTEYQLEWRRVDFEGRDPEQAEEVPEAARGRFGSDAYTPRPDKVAACLWVTSLITMVVLTTCRMVLDGSEALIFASRISLAVFVGASFTFSALLLVDACSINPSQISRGVVCFGGPNNERPYLSRGGRWYRIRAVYVGCLCIGVALASIFVRQDQSASLFCFGVSLMSFTLLFYAGIGCIANAVKARPEQTPLPRFFVAAMCRFALFAAVFSSGMGIFTTYSDGTLTTMVVTGMVLLFCGLAGVMAESLSACHRDSFVPRGNSTVYYRSVLIVNYVGLFGVALGSLIGFLAQAGIAEIAGFTTFLVSLCILSCGLAAARHAHNARA